MNFFLKKLFLQAPTILMTDNKKKVFESLLQTSINHSNAPIDYRCAYPKYEFLFYVVTHYPILLHGSSQKDIMQLEPREQTLWNGIRTKAVFATKDPFWSMFYACLCPRKRIGSIRNACLVYNGRKRENRYYFFSINNDMYQLYPWKEGAIYLLPNENFKQASESWLRFDEWISEQSVNPLAFLEVSPEDFPFLNQVSIHKESENLFLTWLRYKKRIRNKIEF